ncbi:MAG: hypothetical protein ACJAYE_002015, partial [Candidatus Azotimanducaceae bacterium]
SVPLSVPLSVQRQSIFPIEGDDWASIAARELSDIATEEAVSQLQSWNLHVFMRRVAGKDSHQQLSSVLPSDVIFLEPPLAV